MVYLIPSEIPNGGTDIALGKNVAKVYKNMIE